MGHVKQRITNMGSYSASGPPAAGPARRGRSGHVPQPLPQPLVSNAPMTVPGDPLAGLPLDPLYDTTLAGIDRTETTSLNDLTGAENATASQYGFNLQRDPSTGDVTGETLDANNPFSLAAQLTKSYQQQQTGNTNSYAARGQLYAGSLQNAQDASANSYQQGQNTLRSNFENAIRNYIQQAHAAQDTADTGRIGALGDRVSRAIAGGYDPTIAAASPTPQPHSAPPAAARTGTHLRNSRLYQLYRGRG